ncbi:MAG: hypothetical protein ACP5IG_04000 [Candidatus Micrarchaeia archaeon]
MFSRAMLAVFIAVTLFAALPATASTQPSPPFLEDNQKCALPTVKCSVCSANPTPPAECAAVGASLQSEDCNTTFFQLVTSSNKVPLKNCFNDSSECAVIWVPLVRAVKTTSPGKRYWCDLQPRVFGASFSAYPQTSYVWGSWNTTTKANYSLSVYNPDVDPKPFFKEDSSDSLAYQQKGGVKVPQPDVYNVSLTACNSLGFCDYFTEFVSFFPFTPKILPPVAYNIDGKSFAYEEQPISFQVKLSGTYSYYHYFYAVDDLPVSEGGFYANDTVFNNGLKLLPPGQHSVTLISRHYPYSANTTVHFTINPTQNPAYVNPPQIIAPASEQSFDYLSQQPIQVTVKPSGSFDLYDLEIQVDDKTVSTFSCKKNDECTTALPIQDAGKHSLKAIAYAQAFKNSSTTNFTVTPVQPVLAINIYPSTQVQAGTQTTAKCLSNPSSTPKILYRDNTPASNPDTQTLPRGTHYYSCVVEANQNYAPASASQELLVYSELNPVTLTLNGVDSDLTINYKNSVSVQATAKYGSPKLFINGTEVSNPFTAVLAAGYYNFTAFVEGNDSVEPGTATHFLTVKKIPAVLRIFLSPSDSVTQGTETTASCNSYGVPGAVFTRNSTQVQNPDTAVLPAGSYYYECFLPESQNYTASTATPKTLSVIAPVPFWTPVKQATSALSDATTKIIEWVSSLLR